MLPNGNVMFTTSGPKIVEMTREKEVRAEAKSRPEILQIKDIFRAKIVHLAADSLIMEATGDDEKVAALLGLLEPFGIIELARTGRLALKR